MNQKGEATLLGILLMVALTGLVLLCAFELQKSYRLLERRTALFLCAKETKGELKRYLKFMGRTNWAIKNLNRAGLIAAFIPGLQGAATEAQEAKRLIMQTQNFTLIAYMKTFKDLSQKGCPLDPQMLITPFELSGTALARDIEGKALLRKATWTYYLLQRPYLLSLEVNASEYSKLVPQIQFQASEKVVNLSSPFLARF